MQHGLRRTCGAGVRRHEPDDVYGLAQLSTPPLPSTTSQPPATSTPGPGCTQVGCYTEVTGMRALSVDQLASDTMTIETCASLYVCLALHLRSRLMDQAQYVSGDAMTIASCANFCIGLGHHVFGLEYSLLGLLKIFEWPLPSSILVPGLLDSSGHSQFASRPEKRLAESLE